MLQSERKLWPFQTSTASEIPNQLILPAYSPIPSLFPGVRLAELGGVVSALFRLVKTGFLDVILFFLRGCRKSGGGVGYFCRAEPGPGAGSGLPGDGGNGGLCAHGGISHWVVF